MPHDLPVLISIADTGQFAETFKMVFLVPRIGKIVFMRIESGLYRLPDGIDAMFKQII